jgi:hypothetical protein
VKYTVPGILFGNRNCVLDWRFEFGYFLVAVFVGVRLVLVFWFACGSSSRSEVLVARGKNICINSLILTVILIVR